VKIAVIAGDGIGPEVTAQSVLVLNSLRRYDFEFDAVELRAGAGVYCPGTRLVGTREMGEAIAQAAQSS
jgi:isocitrate/isopropylmalate dehydrogenase